MTGFVKTNFEIDEDLEQFEGKVKSKIALLMSILVVFAAVAGRGVQAKPSEDVFVYLPMIVKPAIPATGNVVIVDIFYDGVEGSQEPDEYVEIRNDDSVAIQLMDWTLSDASVNTKTFTFPDYVIQSGEVCRVYTNEIHAATCGFSFGNGAAIWNNTGDCGRLRDGAAVLVDEYCY